MKSVITNSGINLLNQTRADGTVQYWLGYFGLAYVEAEDAEIRSSMTTLTPDGGDNIYNLFQGGMTPVGFNTDIGDSLASSLYGQCLYTSSVLSNYRYVYDEKNDVNQLVVFAKYDPKNAENPTGMYEYYTYKGLNSTDETDLPVPAPLYYMGEPKPYDNLPTFEGQKVSCDTRIYQSNNAETRGPITDPTVMGRYDYADSLDNTYDKDGTIIELNGDDPQHADDWKFQSVSNFNRFHAPASFSGYAVNQDPACRNMAKATKYFPISHYDVISTKDENTVSQVKYTISLDMANVFAKVSNRTTAYYDNTDESDTDVPVDASTYRFGFKFNRIGIYAVPVTLHAYNTLEDSDGNCTEQNVQMQISGNEEPILFAVMQLPSPIVMTEDGVNKYEINFQLDFGVEGNIVNNSAIYYNLYESDAITWYKNQLIANASAANAITDMGVQINYLRKQLNDALLTPSYCGLGDSGDEIGVGYTGLKNLVDTAVAANGGVRGIYTEPEHLGDGQSITVYRRNGHELEAIPDPDNPGEEKIVYADDNDVEAQPLCEIEHYVLGEYSMGLGTDSITAGKRSLNMSNYGIIDEDSSDILLLGGIGKDEDVLDYNRQLAVSNSHDSIIFSTGPSDIYNVNGSIVHTTALADIDTMSGSLFMTGSSDPLTVHRFYESIGFGRLNVTDDSDTASVVEAICGHEYPGTTTDVLLMGENTVDGFVVGSAILSSGNTKVSSYDAMADIDLTYYSSASFDIQEMYTSSDSPVRDTLALGHDNIIGRGLQNIIAASSNSTIPTGSSNMIMLGSNQNNYTGIYRHHVMSVEEFNERYATVDPEDGLVHEYPADDPINMYFADGGIAIIGDGELYGKGPGAGPQPRTKLRDVHGITLYVRYYPSDSSLAPDTWSVGVSGGDVNEYGRYQYGRLYTSSGHNKNMIMLGDNQETGWGSENSIIMGDYSGSRKITLKNSFVNFLGDTGPYDQPLSSGPNATFDNVWWIGSASPKSDQPGSGNGNPPYHAGAYACGNEEYGVIKNKFVFTTDNQYAYSHAYWYGTENPYITSQLYDSTYNSLGTVLYDVQTVVDTQFNSPMIYTGGIALGGYGDDNCNFMLMKVGTSSGYMINYNEDGINDGNNCCRPAHDLVGGIRKVVRSNDYWFSHDTTEIDVYQAQNTSIVTETESTTVTYDIPANHEIMRSKAITLYMMNGQDRELLNIMSLSDTQIVAFRVGNTPIPAETRIYVSYTYMYKNGYTVYDYCRDENYGHHFMTDSPFKGMVLMVQDKQELDGTLHVGLGKPLSGGGFNTKEMTTVNISTKYISDGKTRFMVEFIKGNNRWTEDLDMVDGVTSDQPYNAVAETSDGRIRLSALFMKNTDASMGPLGSHYLWQFTCDIFPKDESLSVELRIGDGTGSSAIWPFDMTYDTNSYINVHGMTNAFDKCVFLTVGPKWICGDKTGGSWFNKYAIEMPKLAFQETNETNLDYRRMYAATPLMMLSTNVLKSYLLTPLRMDIYYNKSGYENASVLRVDSNYMSANAYMNGELPYVLQDISDSVYAG